MTRPPFPSFAEYYAAVHGREPFPWQSALAERVSAGPWPEVIDVPTGLGKTSVIDVAIYELARQSVNAVARSAPTRTALLVDRRLVVDGAFRHATVIAEALEKAEEDTPLRQVADGLLSLVAPGELAHRPLEVVRMRGGVTWAARWLRSPDQPAVVVGTVDQFGSRFLFRGYGTSDRMKPIDAALVGTDMLCLLDEAHLSAALADTVAECQMHEQRSPKRVGRPLTLVQMSATAGTRTHDVHGVTDDDLDSPAADRLTAAKYAALVTLDPKLAKAPETALAELALARLAAQPTAAVGIVVNTVGLARRVFEKLPATTPKALVIGRCRPFDREHGESRWLPRTVAGRDRSTAEGFVLVATQTIEVGVDLDLDTMITQVASADALIQRFGRVDRLGAVGRTHSIIVRRSGDDPVYGASAEHAWEALCSACSPVTLTDVASVRAFDPTDADHVDTVDFGPVAGREWLGRQPIPERLMAPRAPAPLPTAAAISCWRRTAPIPDPDEDVVAYLHGVERWSPTVSVAWRSDLGTDGEPLDPALVDELLALLPPANEELVEVPIGALRGLLTGATTDVADIDGIELSSKKQGVGRTATAWVRRSERWVGATDREVRPGDVVVLPSWLGGHDRFGWTGARADGSDAWVTDVGGLGNGLRLRLIPEVLNPLVGVASSVEVTALVRDAAELGVEMSGRVLELLRAAVTAADSQYAAAIGRRLDLSDSAFVLEPLPRAASGDDEPGRLRVDLVEVSRRARFGRISDDGSAGSSSQSDAPVRLAAHLRSVSQRAGAHAEKLALDTAIVVAIRLAGRFHDLGKAEVRFQTLLHHGRRHAAEAFAADAESALAKSQPATSRGAARSDGSGWPRGMRHEAVSLAMVRGAPAALFADLDRDLVEHLVASHHGHARPFFPPVVDTRPTSAEVEFEGVRFSAETSCVHPALDHAVLFQRLSERYGTWGLALCEAVVRLADMAVSEEGG